MRKAPLPPFYGGNKMVRGTPTVAEAAEVWLRKRKADVSSDTYVNDRSAVLRFTEAVGPARQIGGITVEQVEEYFWSEAERGLRASTFNKNRSRINMFLAYAQRRGWMRVDPMVEVPRQTVHRPERLRLPAQDLARLLDVARYPRDRAIMAVAINTGLRAGEIRLLRVGDVDLAQGLLHVNITKSKMEDQVVITRHLDAELRSWMTWYGEHHPGGVLRSDEYLFPAKAVGSWRYEPNPQPGDVMYANSAYVPGRLQPHKPVSHIQRIVQNALRDVGYDIKSGEGFHTIRRSVGRLFFERASNEGHDAALRTTASLLHHKSVITTELYLGVLTTHVGDATRAAGSVT